MFNIGFPELALIFTAALLLLGPKKLPEFARWVGGALRELRQATNEVRNAIDMELEREEFEKLQQEFQDVVSDPTFSAPVDNTAHGDPPTSYEEIGDFSPASNEGLEYPPIDPDLASSHPDLAEEFGHITQAPEGTVSRGDALDDLDNADVASWDHLDDEPHTNADHPTPEEYPDEPITASDDTSDTTSDTASDTTSADDTSDADAPKDSAASNDASVEPAASDVTPDNNPNR